jgi:hypothetical protein
MRSFMDASGKWAEQAYSMDGCDPAVTDRATGRIQKKIAKSTAKSRQTKYGEE